MILPTWVINLTARVANWNWGFENEHRGVVRDSLNSPAGVFWVDKIDLSRSLGVHLIFDDFGSMVLSVFDENSVP